MARPAWRPPSFRVSFRGSTGPQALAALDAVAASTGSACYGDSTPVSPARRAMAWDASRAPGTIRFSLGRGTPGTKSAFA
jgi:cysteine desulfurase